MTKIAYSIEVDKTPAYGMGTIYPDQLYTVEEIIEAALGFNHIHFGRNNSFNPKSNDEWREWDNLLTALLQKDFWVTLELDSKYAEELHEAGVCEFRKFIPIVSINLAYISLFNYNTTVKINDKEFDATNPGVWHHRLHDLMGVSKFTPWDEYNKVK